MTPRLTRHDCSVLESILTAEASMAASNDEGQKLALTALENLIMQKSGGIPGAGY